MQFIFPALFSFMLLLLASDTNAQVVLSKTSDMFFGILEYDATYNGQVRLATNGALTTTGSGLVVSGVGIPGQVSITATPADVVEVKCRTNATMTLPTGESLRVTRLEGVIDNGVSYGNGARCRNIGRNRPTIAVVDIAANPNPTVLLGGRIRVTGGLASGVYNSSNAGGRAVTVRVIFQ